GGRRSACTGAFSPEQLRARSAKRVLHMVSRVAARHLWGKPGLLLGSTAHAGGTGRLASGRGYLNAQFPLSESPGRFTLR
ncbi:MAG: hypothetical protein OXG71_10170, partial [Rhodospirillales bacterium]|nr:hypothetical protein [Rhodospirillales bacterium]